MSEEVKQEVWGSRTADKVRALGERAIAEAVKPTEEGEVTQGEVTHLTILGQVTHLTVTGRVVHLHIGKEGTQNG